MTKVKLELRECGVILDRYGVQVARLDGDIDEAKIIYYPNNNVRVMVHGPLPYCLTFLKDHFNIEVKNVFKPR